MKFGMNPSPYYRSKRSTTQIMLELFIGLSIIWVCAIAYYFTTSTKNGVLAIVNPIIAMVTAIVTECLFMLPKHLKEKKSFKELVLKLINSYGYVSGIILALLLPVGTSVYAIIISTIFAVAVGKMLFGGFGYNIFNPAILGRIFAQTAFLSQMNYDADISAGATLTTQMGNAGWAMETINKGGYSLFDVLLGSYRGALGETFTLIIVLVGVVLLIRRVIDWRAPVFYVGTIFVATLLMGLIGGYGINSFEYALVQISLGGIMFGAVFCLTDPVTSPTSPSGRVIFAMGAAIVTMLIRYLGSAPEGVAYSILIMNALTPLIDSTVKGLSSQFTRRKIVTTCVMGAIAIASGCVVGATQVNKAGFVSASKRFGLTANVEKLEEEGKISKYHVSVSGSLGINKEINIISLERLYGNAIKEYKNEYLNNPEEYKNAKFVISGKGMFRYLAVTYKDSNKKIVTTNLLPLSVTPVIDESKSTDEKTVSYWTINANDEDYEYKTKYTLADYSAIYDILLKDNSIYIVFASDHKSSDETNASFASCEFKVSLNYEERVILSTEFLSCGGGGGYGDILLSDEGGDPSKYSIDATKAVEFYNTYVKIDSPVSFDKFTKERYDQFGTLSVYEEESIRVGATYTAIGYMALMQAVIDYATAEHTVGKVVL